MPDTYAAIARDVIGKKVSVLRGNGIIPANIYGRGIDSVPVQILWPEARGMLNAHGRNVLIQIQIEGEAQPRSVVIRDFTRDPVNGSLQHIDFFQVDLTRKIQADIPVQLVGESPAVHTYGGILVQSLELLHVEALPTEMPESIQVSVESLGELESSLTVGDIQAPEGVSILTAPDVGLAQIARPRVEQEESEEIQEGEDIEGVVSTDDSEVEEEAD